MVELVEVSAVEYAELVTTVSLTFCFASTNISSCDIY